MAQHFAVEIVADHPSISFDLKYRGAQHIVRMNNGAWELMTDGGVRSLARGSIHWTEALRRAIEMVEST